MKHVTKHLGNEIFTRLFFILNWQTKQHKFLYLDQYFYYQINIFSFRRVKQET